MTSPVRRDMPTLRSKVAAPIQYASPAFQSRTWWRRRGLRPSTLSNARSWGRPNKKCRLTGAEEYGRSKRMLAASRSPDRHVIGSAGSQPAARMAETTSSRVPTRATFSGSAGIPSAVREQPVPEDTGAKRW